MITDLVGEVAAGCTRGEARRTSRMHPPAGARMTSRMHPMRGRG